MPRFFQTAFLCAGIFFLSGTACAATADLASKQAELNHVQDHLQQLQKTLTQDQSQQVDLQNQLKSSEMKISQLSQQIASLDQQFTLEESQLEKLKAQQENFTNQLALQRTALSTQIRMLYFLGKTQALKTILNPDDISTISRHIYYYHYLSQARSDLMTEIKQVLTTLNNNVSVITAHEKHLKKLLSRKQQEQLQQQLAQEQRQKIIAQLDLQTQDKQQQIVGLASNQKDLQSMLESLQQKLQTEAKKAEEAPKVNTEIPQLAFNRVRGRLEWPIHGSRAVTFGLDSHQTGIIIKAPEGTPVHAIYGGKVIFASWLKGFGLLVIINHGNGYMSLYARNHALYAKVGDVIKPREVIASIGNTGGYVKSSLYFEIRQNGTPVNPSIWCR